MLPMKAATSPLLLLSVLLRHSAGWGGNGGSFSYAIFGNGLARDWISNSQGISIAVHGCLWSYMTDKNNEDAGCQEQSSEDGTQTWYWMSNCRRAQVAYSVYASDSSSSPSCNSATFKESVSCARCDLMANHSLDSFALMLLVFFPIRISCR